jgi:hypothetical protein
VVRRHLDPRNALHDALGRDVCLALPHVLHPASCGGRGTVAIQVAANWGSDVQVQPACCQAAMSAQCWHQAGFVDQ